MKHDSFRSVYLLRVCLCVRVPLRVGGYVYARLCVYVRVRVCVCMGASVCVCACACVCTCVRVCVSTELPSHAGCQKSVVLKQVKRDVPTPRDTYTYQKRPAYTNKRPIRNPS